MMNLIKFINWLRTYYTRGFVDGILSLVAHEDDLKDMCDWIDKYPNATESEIICKALDLNIPRTEPERIIR